MIKQGIAKERLNNQKHFLSNEYKNGRETKANTPLTFREGCLLLRLNNGDLSGISLAYL